MVAVSVEQRSYIRIEYLRGKSGKEIHENLCEACGNNTGGYIGRFSAGKADISDEARSGKPHEATDPYHVEKVKEVLDEDRRLTCDEVAEGVGISHRSALEIITRHLKMRRIAARWVPHFLTCDQMKEEHIIRHEKEGETFLNHIVAIDETWLRSYEPELKSQTTEWHSPASPRPAKFRRKQGNLKQLAIFAYDSSGLLTTDYVTVGEIVNGEYYSNFLRKKNATSYA